MTSRLLANKQKKEIRIVYKDNSVLQTITAAYKDFERKMKGYRFSPEDVWLNCFIYFDNIIDAVDKEQCVNKIWDDIYCDIHDCLDDGDYECNKDDVILFTSCVAYSIIGCLVASNEVKYVLLPDDIMSQISDHTELDVVAIPFDRSISANYTDYISSYLKEGIPLSRTIDTYLKYGRLDNKIEEETLIKTNKIFRTEIVYNGERRKIVLTKLKLFIEEFFVQKCQNGYEWVAVFLFSEKHSLLLNREFSDYSSQMQTWFSDVDIKCPDDFRHFTFMKGREPEDWAQRKPTKNMNSESIKNITARYNTLMDNFSLSDISE